jgi:hypothetical protein
VGTEALLRCRVPAALGVLAVLTGCGPSPELTVTHGEAIRDSVQQTLADLTRYSAGSTVQVETAYQDLQITPLGPGLAPVVTRFQTQIGDATAGGFSFGGMITMTLIHRPEGWRILNGHTSSARERR